MQSETKGLVRSQAAEALTHVLVQASLHGQPWGQWLFCSSAEAQRQAFRVGWSGKAHAPVGPQVVADPTHDLIAFSERGCSLHLTNAMVCTVRAKGVDQPCVNTDVALPRGQAAWIHCGAFTFVATWQPPPVVVARSSRRSWRSLWPEALVGSLLLLVLLVLRLVPPDPMALSIWKLDRTLHMPDATTIPPVAPKEKPVVTEPPGLPSQPSRSTLKIPRPPKALKPVGQRQPLAGTSPQQAGMLKVLSELGASRGVMGSVFAPGGGLGEALQGLSRADGALGEYTGGMQVSLNDGPAGRTIGDGSLHTVGECAPGQTCSARPYGAQAGLLRKHVARAPLVLSPCEPGNPLCAARGALDKELVRREVRKHLSEIKFCYEQQLMRAPSLAGRVAVRFVIVATGHVAASSIAESSLGNARVEACVADAVKRWQFPVARQAGATIVTYPFSFSPAGG